MFQILKWTYLHEKITHCLLEIQIYLGVTYFTSMPCLECSAPDSLVPHLFQVFVQRTLPQ